MIGSALPAEKAQRASCLSLMIVSGRGWRAFMGMDTFTEPERGVSRVEFFFIGMRIWVIYTILTPEVNIYCIYT